MSAVKNLPAMEADLTRWIRIVLRSILAYEAAGAITGGVLLLVAPDGSLLDMPAEMMHGFFSDFFIPGMILLGLGFLCALAFISVLRRRKYDWLWACLAIGGMTVWFVVEIIVLQELHWLHLMWGFPVYLGIVTTMPLVAARFPTATTYKLLLSCGILSSLWYIAINIYVPLHYEGYSMRAYTVSELSAIGAPTRVKWVLLTIPYPVLFAAFGWGVLQSAAKSRSLRIVGWLIIAYCIFNFYWPPMQMRGNEMALTDVMHIAWAFVTLLCMIFIMGFGAAALGRWFRLYTIATFAVFIIFGAIMGTEAPGLAQDLPTPHLGVWERINMAAFFLWVIVFAIALLQKRKGTFMNEMPQ